MNDGNHLKPHGQSPRGRQTYWYMEHKYLFDVDKALRIVADGRQSVELAEESVRQSVAQCGLNADHVREAITDIPGIVAHVFYRTEDGELLRGHLLIDGHHRAARCLQLRLPFRAYLLTEAESLATLLRCPEGSPMRCEDLDRSS